MWQRLFLVFVSMVLLGLPSSSSAATPTVGEVLETYRANRQRLDPLHVQLHHTNEFTDAFRAHHRLAAERQEVMVKSVREMTRADFKKMNPQLPPGYTVDFLISQMKQQLDFNQSMANQTDHEHFVELFQKGEAYQIRTPAHLESWTPSEWVFPTESLTKETLMTTYDDIIFFSWAPQLSPHGMSMNASREKMKTGRRPWFASVTAKHYSPHTAIPAFSRFAVLGTQSCHPIDEFFRQSPESYKMTGTETLDGRELLVVEVPVQEERSKTVCYHRAWLDMARGALPAKLHIWRGFDETKLATLSQRAPDQIMTTDEIREVTPGSWYPSMTVEEKFERDAEKMPKTPQSQLAEEWEMYTTEVATVPSVVHRREIWRCDLVEVQAPLTDEFFLLPVPEGTEVKDHDGQDKYDFLGNIPVDGLTELAKFTEKLWLQGPLSALNGISDDE